MQCLTDTGTGFVLTSPQPTDYTTCTYLLVQQPDIAVNAWALTTSQGTQIALAIAICWAIGWAFRAAISLLKPNESENQNE
jgi:hypothetical protein